jgi:Domain of unknown function (DUF4157)
MRTHIDAKPVVARQGSGGTAERQAKPETAVRLATLARGNTRAESPYRWANAQLLAARPQAPDRGPRMHVNSKIDKPVTSSVPVVQRVRGLLKGTRVKLKKNADDKEPGEGIIDKIVGDVYHVKKSPFADDEDSEIKDNYRQEFVEPFFSIGASARANEPETKHSDDQATGDEKTAARTSMGSQSMALAAQGSTIVFANVSELYEAKATRILTLLSRHPTIMKFLNDRGSNCIITLVKGTVPGHVDMPIEEHGGDVQVRLATWYFEKYELGYVMAMLSHEFGIHPIANAFIGTEETKNVPVEKGQQADHLVGANWTSSRNAVYRNLVLETALLMESDGATQVLDAFLMDCATILATNDRRAKGLLRSQLVADYYNEYRGYLENLIGQKANQQPEMKDLRLPPKKGADDVSLNYKQAASRLLTGYWSKASVKPQRSATDNRSASSRQRGQSAESNATHSRTQSAPAQHSTDVKETTSSSPEIELTQFKRRPAVQPGIASSPASAAVNATRLPDRLAAGIEHLTGLAMDDVRVHYNSAKPTQLHALAYTQGTNIHVGHGQERHLPHEAWHVAQQKQGRVKPTLQMKGVAINDDGALEREADAMGTRAAQMMPLDQGAGGWHVDKVPDENMSDEASPTASETPVQRKVGFEIEMASVYVSRVPTEDQEAKQPLITKGDTMKQGAGWKLTPDGRGEDWYAEFITDAVDEFKNPEGITTVMSAVMEEASRINNLESGELDMLESQYAIKKMGTTVRGRFQITGGVKIDQLVNLLSKLSDAAESYSYDEDQEDDHDDIRWNDNESDKEMLQKTGKMFAKTAEKTLAQKREISGNYKGLVALVSSYVAGQQLGSQQSNTDQPVKPDYAKQFVPVMSRTNLGQVRDEVPNMPALDDFVTDVLEAAEVKANGADKLFPAGIEKGDPQGTIDENPNITIREWLTGIYGSKDLTWSRGLTSENKPFELEDVGPTDVSNRAKGAIVELRYVEGQVEIEGWQRVADIFVEVFKTLNDSPTAAKK